jgi:hypothetical protein
MREICLSGSMSANRKQNRAKPDCGGEAKAQPKEATGRLKPLRLFSTLLRGLEMECSHFLLAYPAIASIQHRYITAHSRRENSFWAVSWEVHRGRGLALVLHLRRDRASLTFQRMRVHPLLFYSYISYYDITWS